ncbi:hypothetical protein GWI56_017645 [Shewanella sp. DW31]|nr:hypothetical protein [Shewanella sp. DW31]
MGWRAINSRDRSASTFYSLRFVMNVQIHPSYFRKIVLSEPFSQMIDVAAASGSITHKAYVCLAIAHFSKLLPTSVNPAVEAEINRRNTILATQYGIAGGVA